MKRFALVLICAAALAGCATTHTTTTPGGDAPSNVLAAPPTASSSTGQPITMGVGAEDIARLDTLLAQTRELALLAPDVARVKWNTRQPVANARAENAMVAAAAREAAKYKADPGLFRDFFSAQIEAAKFVQTKMIEQWREAKAPKTMTLTRSPAQIQAASDAITPKLMQALADAAPVLKIPGARAVLETRAKEILPTKSALSDPTREIAIRPLLERAAP